MSVRSHVLIMFVASALFAWTMLVTGNNLHGAGAVVPAAVVFLHAFFLSEGRRRRSSAMELSGPGLVRRGFMFISSYSYSLYLLHFSVISYLWFAFHGRASALVLIPVALVASNLVAAGFYWLVERHYRRAGSWIKKKVLRSGNEKRTIQVVK